MKRKQTEKMLSSKPPNFRFTYYENPSNSTNLISFRLSLHWILIFLNSESTRISCFSKSTRRETCILLTPHLLQTKRFMEFRVQDPVRDFRFSVYLSFIEIVKYSLRVEIAPRNSGKIFLKKHGSATES